MRLDRDAALDTNRWEAGVMANKPPTIRSEVARDSEGGTPASR
jgi:hypothetical protein